ncbi:hypothetical protein ACNQF7_10120 [Flavobacterium sp. RSP29]|uniref:hypothetical protein n=1 Tax=Flavobacterium sp. RSP29 TaxID=3401731 RepID=UPI003AAFFBC4
MIKKPIVLNENKLAEIKDVDSLLLTGGISANAIVIPKEQLSYLSGARSNLQAQIDAKVGSLAGFTDSFSLKIKATDSIATPTDSFSMSLKLTQSDTNAGQTETASLKFPQPDFADTSGTPTESSSFKIRVWLSSSSGATNPTNADGSNNGTVASISTAPAGAATVTLTSVLGVNIPTLIITSAIYRSWFKSVNTLVSGNGNITIRSTNALFSDIIIFTNSGLNTTVDKLDGSFTYDLILNGINTLEKLKSIQILHKTTDAAAGVTPHVLTVDAGCIEIAATL